MATNNNPWRGLASYKDPQDCEQQYEFCGRDTETLDLVNLIDSNLFVTLYGRTGVGKTSLLNAGVFPILRGRNYLPIYVRLSQESVNKKYGEAIVKKIGKIVEEKKFKKTETSAAISANSRDITYLWNYFHTTTFEDDKGNKIYPVVVLDQFEEIFFSKKEDAVLLLRQIYALLGDDYVVPTGDQYHNETNYRFVISLREDNLFYLEDYIDELSLNIYKENRYRLRPFCEENAHLAILSPGYKHIDEKDADAIVDKIVELSRDKDGSISSLILSLICYLMYEHAMKLNGVDAMITLEQVPSTAKDANKILQDFYLASTNNKQRKIIEGHLLTNDGHRKAADIEIPNVEDLLSGGTRILQKIETDTGTKIEITHDRLAEVVYAKKMMQRKAYTIYVLGGLFAVIIVFLIGIILKQNKDNDNLKLTNKDNYHNIAIVLKEDTTITPLDFWSATLLVIKDKGNVKDTIHKEVNKTNCGVALEIKDTLNSVKVELQFSTLYNNYKSRPVQYNSNQLKSMAYVELVVKKEAVTAVPYNSSVFVDIDGVPHYLEDAIVILGDQTTRTDSLGRFHFSMSDSLTASDNLYVLWGKSQLYKREKLELINGNLPDTIKIVPKDSLEWFKQECKVDTMNYWLYGVTKNDKDAHNPIHIFANKMSGKKNGKYLIYGYYYFKDDQIKFKEKKYQYYHLFTGWMDSREFKKYQNLMSKPYEIESYDIVGNKQKIVGEFSRRYGFTGQILKNGNVFYTFGVENNKDK